ncbi:MAG: hypothetical protein LBJ08_06120 [Bifidobacteriaceae bacterium]|jgi:hypothetical protein|nr:hypothetical protein [Bifidobacteriaceae bacterium]
MTIALSTGEPTRANPVPRSRARRPRGPAALLAAVAVAALAAGCAGTEGSGTAGEVGTPTAPPPSAKATQTGSARDASPQVDNTATAIEVLEQSYESNDIVEILWLTYDGQQPALEEAGWKNPEIEAINRDIQQTVFLPAQQREPADGDWVDRLIDIRSYPFTSEDYLQIVTTSVAYPNNGSVGALYSWVFDRRANAWVPPESAYGEAGLSGDALREAVAAAFVPVADGDSVVDVEPSGFVFVQGGDGWVPRFLVTVRGVDGAGTAWDAFFSYQPTNPSGRTLTRLNSSLLFDPAEPDATDPPLMYAGPVADSGMWLDLPAGVAAELTGSGTDPSGHPWAEYIAEDGAMAVSIRGVAGEATTDPEEMRVQVLEGAVGVDPDTWQVDEEDSVRIAESYGYPIAVYQFDSGANEDLLRHIGLYIPTGAGGFVVDFSTDADTWDETSAVARDWMTRFDLSDIPLG